jgi:di/tricarboxylate transporter
MSWEAIFTLCVAVGALVIMATDRASPDKTLLGALAVLLLSGVLTTKQALAGFANEGLATIAVLFIVAAAVRRTGALAAASARVLGRPKSVLAAQLRLMIPVAGLSAFVNNTPLVAMLLPEVRDWARRSGVAPSRLLIPLSYAAILGGVVTLIGTSTNLVVDGMMRQSGLPGLGFFDLTWVGLPVALIGIALCVLLGRRLLPDRQDRDMPFADPRAFTAEFTVVPGGPFDGKRLADVVIPDLPGLHPIEILRDGGAVPAPRAEEQLRAGDRLVVSLAVGHVLALHRTPGLDAADSTYSREVSGSRALIELVVSDGCPLVGKTVGDGSFRRHYDAAVVAVARHGERVNTSEPWILRTGDTLLVEASADFLALHRTSPDFYVVTDYGEVRPARQWHRIASVAAFGAMALLAALGVCSMLEAGVGAAIFLLGARVVSWTDVRDDINWGVLLTIAASLGVGTALEVSGGAKLVGDAIASVGTSEPWLALALVFGGTVLLTEMVTNNAAAAMMLPVGLAAASRLGVSHMPFVMAVMFAASASFATPIGYQTNLMVYGPGGYRFSDFMRMGIPLTVLLGAVTLVLTPIFWPF